MQDAGGYRERGLSKSIDWKLVITYLILIVIGWFNIYASVHSEEPASIFDWTCRSGKQFVWIITSLCIAGFILFVLSPRVYEGLSTPIYLITLGLLVAVIFLGIEVKGSRSWFEFGPVRFQPAEISKISTSLMLATVMSQLSYKISRFKDFIVTALIILVPMGIIVAQSETGSALVYVGFIFMLYREGLSGWLIFMMGMAILLFILGCQQRILVEKILTLLVVLIQSHAIQLRNHFIELLQVAMVCLLAHSLGIRIAIAAGQGCRLPHGVHHGLLTLENILILVLLIQSIVVQIIGELLTVQDLVQGIIELGLPLRLIGTRLACKLLLEQCLCLQHTIALVVLARSLGQMLLK